MDVFEAGDMDAPGGLESVDRRDDHLHSTSAACTHRVCTPD